MWSVSRTGEDRRKVGGVEPLMGPLGKGSERGMRVFSYGVHWLPAAGQECVGMNAPTYIRPLPSRTNDWVDELNARLTTPSVIPLTLRIGMGVTAAATLLMFLGALVGMGGCESDNVGHTKTVEKQVVDTPTEKTTVTTTHEKNTTISR